LQAQGWLTAHTAAYRLTAMPLPAADRVNAGSSPASRHPPSWRALHPGDDPAVEMMQFEHWRTASSAAKMRELASLNDTMLRLALAGLAHRNSSADRATLRRLLADLVLGQELAAAAYGPPDQTSRR
jgi:hypothetical protein